MRKKYSETDLERARMRILEAALALGREPEAPKSLMQATASGAGVSLSTLYKIYESKEHLLHELAARLQEEARIQTGAQRLKEDAIAYATRAAIHAHEVWVAHPTLARLILQPYPTGTYGKGLVYGRTNPFSAPGEHGPAERLEALMASVWLGTTVARLAGHMRQDEAQSTLALTVESVFTALGLPETLSPQTARLVDRWTLDPASLGR